ncbi:Ankyrin repeat protein 1 [Giardia muris]|uniref:Ankyrin repeat protein 1 n=1 Tax=Giardia muris TaxID=5742 RepID=A0A4Z1STW5_GIAMU|nr:Ankyrin repeat protein 1 [Giardia muris]|eukprot:TNJ29346.1 Ankyrin repeat protein 1 [Giardia muris]
MSSWFEACEKGDVDFVRAHVETWKRHADAQGLTGLMLAAQAGHLAVVRLLQPFEYSLGDAEGWTALLLAARSGNAEVCAALARHEERYVLPDGRTALMVAASAGHVSCIEPLLLLEGVRDLKGWIALTYAAAHGHLDCVRMLLEKSTCLTEKDIEMAMRNVKGGGSDGIQILAALKGHRVGVETYPAILDVVLPLASPTPISMAKMMNETRKVAKRTVPGGVARIGVRQGEPEKKGTDMETVTVAPLKEREKEEGWTGWTRWTGWFRRAWKGTYSFILSGLRRAKSAFARLRRRTSSDTLDNAIEDRIDV